MSRSELTHTVGICLMAIGVGATAGGVFLPLRDTADFVSSDWPFDGHYYSPTVMQAGHGWAFIVFAALGVAEVCRLLIWHPRQRWIGLVIGVLTLLQVANLRDTAMHIREPDSFVGDIVGIGTGLRVTTIGGVLMVSGVLFVLWAADDGSALRSQAVPRPPLEGR